MQKNEKKNRLKYSEEQSLLDQNEERRLLKEKENAKKKARAEEEGRICDTKYKEINE